MIYGSLCSGIEAATQAWHPLGWRPAFFSEIDAFPSAVLAHHYGSNLPGEAPSGNGVPNYGDMTRFQEWPNHAIDVLVGGTPCQSFSVAGLRKGLADPRGNLMLTFGAVAQKYRPKWVVWENVPGVLSSDGGRDFGTFLGMLAELGYGFAYRVLDAQYVRTRRFARAVPQRRRRVFVVGYLGDWRRAAAVLFDRESLSGHPAPRREAGQGAAPPIGARPSGGGGLGTDFDLDGGLIPQGYGGGRTSGPVDVAACLVAKGQKCDFEVETFVAHALRGEGFDASEDGTGRGTPIVPVAPTLRAGGNSTGGNRPYGTDVDTCDSLIPVAIQERAISENPDAGPDGIGCRQDGAAYTLEARTVPQAVAFDCKGTEVQYAIDGSHPTLRSMGHNQSHQNAGGHAAVAFDMRGREGGAMQEGPHDTANIRAASGGSSRRYIAQPWAVRRLMPVECERLQGFPDDFTRIPYRGKPADRCPDGPRYKALGNSMAVNVMAWIGERIALVDAMDVEE